MENSSPSLLDLLSLGLVSGVCVALGTGIGWGLDTLFGTGPVLTAVGLLLGVVAAVAGTWSLARRMLNN